MTYKNKMTIYSFIIRHNCPNLLYVTYLHDVLYVCTTSICFLFSQRDHNENKVYFWPVLCYPCHSILIVKLLDTYIVFCKVVFYTHLLYLFVVANKYLLTYLLERIVIIQLSADYYWVNISYAACCIKKLGFVFKKWCYDHKANIILTLIYFN